MREDHAGPDAGADAGADVGADTEERDLRSLGEFGLIDRLRRRLGADERVDGRSDGAGSGGVGACGPAGGAGIDGPGELGLGDDAAVVALRSDRVVWTVDTLVDGVHFLSDRMDPVDLGYKSLAVNVSDVAAMGARPRAALVAWTIPKDTRVETLDGLWRGLWECAEEYSCPVVGGDTTSGPVATITVTVIGEPGPRVVTRAGAGVDELVCVTGTVGGSAAGLELLRASSQGSGPTGSGPTGSAPTGSSRAEARLVSMHVRPRARVDEGESAAREGATAMIDVSDGLVADLAHICEESGIGIRLDADRVPLADGIEAVAERFGVDPVEWGLYGGEDYELAMTVPRERLESLRAAIEACGGVLSVIGHTVEGADVTVVGHEDRERRGGWDHFSDRSGA